MYSTGFEAVGEMWDLKLEVLEGLGGGVKAFKLNNSIPPPPPKNARSLIGVRNSLAVSLIDGYRRRP